jgi:zinc/manganese transport system substrate-binding protein
MSLARRFMLLVLALLVAAPAGAAEKLPVVASFSILGDLLAEVGGERVAVTTLVGPNGDAHVYQPSPADARALAAAKLVVVNGLGFEGWMPRLLRASGTTAPVIEAARGIAVLEARGRADHNHDHAHKHDHDHDHKHDHQHAHDHDHGPEDPHAWHDIDAVKVYVRNIAEALAAADPAGAAVYAENAARYTEALEALRAELAVAIATVPESERRIITSHDAFGYLARAFAIEILSPVGLSTEAEPTAADLARLIRQMKAQAVRAAFIENIADRRLIDQIVRETGASVGGRLYSDALSGAEGAAPDYLSLMRHNVTTIVAALKR